MCICLLVLSIGFYSYKVYKLQTKMYMQMVGLRGHRKNQRIWMNSAIHTDSQILMLN